MGHHVNDVKVDWGDASDSEVLAAANEMAERVARELRGGGVSLVAILAREANSATAEGDGSLGRKLALRALRRGMEALENKDA